MNFPLVAKLCGKAFDVGGLELLFYVPNRRRHGVGIGIPLYGILLVSKIGDIYCDAGFGSAGKILVTEANTAVNAVPIPMCFRLLDLDTTLDASNSRGFLENVKKSHILFSLSFLDWQPQLRL